jgi:hypothetical protein
MNYTKSKNTYFSKPKDNPKDLIEVENSGKNHWNYGKHWSEEIKQRMRLKELGKKKNISNEVRKIMSEKGKRKKNNLGKHWKLSDETKRKMSDAVKGEKSYLWKGGISSVNTRIRQGLEFRLWRESVFVRDNFTCQKYGLKAIKGTGKRVILHPHHIQNFSQFPELRFAIDNGITLSKKAHDEFHKRYGKQNNTKEQLEEFLCLK